MSYKIDLLSILEVSKRNEEERKEREKKDEKDNYKKLVQTHLKTKGKCLRWDSDTEEYIYSYPKSLPMTIDNVTKKKITFKTLDIE
jgi:hypothetical protein